MSRSGSSNFSAADSTLGYLYQVRVALLWALRKLKSGPDFIVSVETLDDVTFQSKGDKVQELLQTKHHLKRSANLSDASPDLWKTLRVWFEGSASGQIQSAASLQLLTTALASAGSAASKLKAEDRDIDGALASLEATARSSANTANAPAYKVFLAASDQTRRAILERVFIIDSAPTAVALEDSLIEEIFWAVDRQHHDVFLERLEGWWLHRVLKQLSDASGKNSILAEEVEAQMSDLREQFKQDALPIDEDLLNFALDEATKTAHASSKFVRQLELIKAGKVRVAAAIRDYYRAFEQRSRWLRDDLLMVGDLDKYERRLLEEWELVFSAMKDEIGEEAAEEAKHKAARDVLKWAERTSIPIRPNVTEPFVTRGSLHMLADEVRLGWHPDFRERLADLLGESQGAE